MDEDISVDNGSESVAPSESVVETPSWFWDENTPGTGDRPDYLSSKFKSVAEAAKSYSSLEKKLGTAPKEYDFGIAKNWLDADFEPLQEAAQFAKEKQVSQEVIDKLLGATTMYLESSSVNTENEIGKLGDNAQERLTVVNNWAKANFSEQTFNTLVNTMDTADSVVAMEEVRKMMLNNVTNVPTSNDSATNNTMSLEDVQSELTNNIEKYKTDAKYRKEMSAKIEQASRGGSFIDK